MTITSFCCCDSKKTKTETKPVSAPKQETVISETKKETEIKNTKTSEDTPQILSNNIMQRAANTPKRMRLKNQKIIQERRTSIKR